MKSKLDEKPLREIAQATGGFYVHLENGPRTMQQIYNEGLAKMQAAEIDVRLSRRPIERYEWPLGAAIIALALSILIGERKRVRERSYVPSPVKAATATAALAIFCCQFAFATTPGLKAYRDGKFEDAYSHFQETLKAHPQSRAEDKLQFDSGAAAYKLKDYGKALESFSQALLSRDTGLQSKSHYNLGNTLYQRGEAQKSDEKKLSDWTNALDHYEQTLKVEPQNKEAKENYDYVKKKIEDLKNKKQPEQQPSPSPSPPQKDKQDNQNQQQHTKPATTRPAASNNRRVRASSSKKTNSNNHKTNPGAEKINNSRKRTTNPRERTSSKSPSNQRRANLLRRHPTRKNKEISSKKVRAENRPPPPGRGQRPRLQRRSKAATNSHRRPRERAKTLGHPLLQRNRRRKNLPVK